MKIDVSKKMVSNTLKDWYEPFMEFLFKYPYLKTVESDISLNLPMKNYLQNVFPNWKRNYCELDNKQRKRKEQLKLLDNYNEDFFFMTKTKETKLLSFIHHFRNAIAHGNIKFNDIYVEIRDYFYNPSTHKFSKTPNAFFKVKCDELRDFILELNKKE